MNTAPGYRCDACPLGYTGLPVEGVGVLFAQTNKQVKTFKGMDSKGMQTAMQINEEIIIKKVCSAPQSATIE